MSPPLHLHPDRLFPADPDTRAVARRLYTEIKGLPIVSPHGHTDPSWFPRTRPGAGLSFMDSPGFDPCSATGQIASGANLIAFTTGRGSVFGSKPAPCLKIASNARLAGWMAEDIDVDASSILDGASIDSVGDNILQRLLSLASGEPSASELLGIGDAEFVPWQMGAYL